jgi:hypothetical protein
MTVATQLELGRTDAAAAPLRADLQVASVASGLLLLLDAHRLTGRLPLEVQVQIGRLRHAVKLAIQAHASSRSSSASPAPGPGRGGPSYGAADLDRGSALGPAWPPGLGVPDALLVVNRPGGRSRWLGRSAAGRGRPRGR